MAHTIFFDESGFTGSRLLDAQQKAFVYASVRMQPEEADELATRVKTEFHLQDGAFRGKNLIKSSKGLKAILRLLENCAENVHVLFFNKEYALACKFFEYIVEPAISENNSVFYRVGFHKFFATVLHIYCVVGASNANQMLQRFETFMRSGQPERDIASLMNVDVPVNPHDFITQVRDFIRGQEQAIVEEARSLHKMDVDPWILDLTTTALFTLLSYWGESSPQMTVICDESKPLRVYKDIVSGMIGRKDRHYITFGGRRRLMTFNLTELPILSDSRIHPGVQVADIVASVTRYYLENPDNTELDPIRVLLNERVSPESNVPDLKHMDLEEPLPKANAMLWLVLVERARVGADLLAGIEEFICCNHGPNLMGNPIRVDYNIALKGEHL